MFHGANSHDPDHGRTSAAPVEPPVPVRNSNAPGFSLIEAMLAMSILAVGLLIAAQMIPMALRTTTQTSVRTNAVQVAQRRLDDLRAQDFHAGVLTAGVYSASEGNYNLSWAITDSIPVPGNKRITLTTSWDTANGPRETTLTTYISANN